MQTSELVELSPSS
ncbi:hypothetical protein F383_39031 [Gossypium arboreum]|nr:hypothetical protein F383_39031 [Gossypium arboreum]